MWNSIEFHIMIQEPIEKRESLKELFAFFKRHFEIFVNFDIRDFFVTLMLL